jgi:hypothetical protein
MLPKLAGDDIFAPLEPRATDDFFGLCINAAADAELD